MKSDLLKFEEHYKDKLNDLAKYELTEILEADGKVKRMINKIESGKLKVNQLSKDDLADVCDYLGCKEEDLIKAIKQLHEMMGI